MVYNIGDVVVCGRNMGVVTKVAGDFLTCDTDTYQTLKYRTTECTLYLTYKEVLEAFNREICNACR